MFRLIIAIILIGSAVAGFLMFTEPFYQDIKVLKDQSAAYDEALNNSKALENERDKLTQKYNSIAPENLDKLSKLLPNNVDNIRLILEIEKVAAPYGMTLKDVRYSPVAEGSSSTTPDGIVQESAGARGDYYGSWDLEFSTEGTYNNFNNFIRDLEKNLRIVDIASIEFSSSAAGGVAGINLFTSDVYKYSFKIKTYWLKN